MKMRKLVMAVLFAAVMAMCSSAYAWASDDFIAVDEGFTSVNGEKLHK